jgi:ribonuclease HI
VQRTKYYAVWKGRRTGVFSSWEDCQKQVKGFVGAEFKAFDSMDEARRALASRYEDFAGKASSIGKWRRSHTRPKLPSIAVDAACSGSPGRLEYRGVITDSGSEIFRAGPFAEGTNNVGEFLAIVEALRWLKANNRDWTVYSDSENAIGWVRQGRARTKLKRTAANRRLFEMIADAEAELGDNKIRPAAQRLVDPPILKWDTAEWGEIPADFGRK